MQFNTQLFKDIVCHYPTGVTVITTKFQGKYYGFTANSFTSVSLLPPLVSFSLNKVAGSHRAFINSESFAINFLSKDQTEIAHHFASKIPDKFHGQAYHLGVLDSPLLRDTIAYLECATKFQYEGGDHTIFIGEVIEGNFNDCNIPALYYKRRFHSIRD